MKRLHTEVGKVVGRISLGKKMNLFVHIKFGIPIIYSNGLVE